MPSTEKLVDIQSKWASSVSYTWDYAALMAAVEWTTAQGSSTEACIKACSALSNLAIGYGNKIPMFRYLGFVEAILNVIQTDTGEAHTKACSILWRFPADMNNQVPVIQWGVLVEITEEHITMEARIKCVACLLHLLSHWRMLFHFWKLVICYHWCLLGPLDF